MRKAEHLDELMPYLMGEKQPLWEGEDDTFASEVQEAFGVPSTIRLITITPRTPSGTSAVAIGSTDGAIVFVLTHDLVRRTLHVSPTLMGPLYEDKGVIARANALAADAGKFTQMITDLTIRCLGHAGALQYLAPDVH
jgi:hypothetical protein